MKNKEEFINIILMFTFYLSTIEGLIEDVPFMVMTIGNINHAEPFLEGITTLEKEKLLYLIFKEILKLMIYLLNMVILLIYSKIFH